MLRGLEGPDVRVVVTGMGTAAAEHHTALAIAHGAVAAISTGFCGALDSALQLGDVVVPERVVDAVTGEAFACAPGLTIGAGTRGGTLITTPRIAGDPSARAALTGTVVDMESAGIARACARAGVPFAAVRAVTDRVGDVLPDFTGLVDDDGRVHGMAMARRLLAHPAQITAWARLARGANAARRGLVPAVTAMLADAA